MTLTYKVLGQSNPAATTDTDVYTCPSATQTVISTINVCNQAASSATFRIAVRPNGATLSAAHYLAYDTTIPANDSISLTLGITIDASDVVTVRASTATISFNVFGTEVTA